MRCLRHLSPLLMALLTALLVVTVAVGSPERASRAQGDCTISQNRSLAGAVRTSIHFYNDSNQAVDIYWLDYNGQRVLYNHLAAYTNYVQGTWYTHPWVAVNPAGVCVGYTIAPNPEYHITGSITPILQLCMPNCRNGVKFSLQPTFNPGQTSLPLTASCSSGSHAFASGPAAVSGFASICDGVIKVVTPPEISKVLGPLVDGIKGLFGQDLPSAPFPPIFDFVQPLTEPEAHSLDNVVQKWDSDLHNSSNPADAAGLHSIDSDLSPTFTAEAVAARALASPASRSIDTAPMPNPSNVLRAIYASHPTAADIAAFNQALTLATAQGYSPARAEARVTLVLAVAIGRRTLAHDIKRLKSRTVVIATKHVKVSGTKSLTLQATPLGGRILRAFSIAGLSHRVTVKLQVVSTQNKKTSRASRSLVVR